MNCPVCDGRLRPVEKYGVEVDICPECKGVWLDRGELEKIIELVESGGPVRSKAEQPVERDYRTEDRRPEYYDEHKHEHEHEHEKHHDDHYRNGDQESHIDPKTGRPKRRESWITEIFDAFGGGGD